MLIVSMIAGSLIPVQAKVAPCSQLAGAWCAETRVASGQPAAGATMDLQVTVVSRDYELPDTIVDVEIYSERGERVAQRIYEHEHLARGAQKKFLAHWTPSAPGIYTVKVGLFTASWSYLHYWNDAAGVIQVARTEDGEKEPAHHSAAVMHLDASVRHPISPYIYGTNFQAEEHVWDGVGRNLTFARFGGNRLSTYNWETNASNAGSDWQHQNDAYLGGGGTPAGAVRSRVSLAHAANAAALVTIPMLGYAARDAHADGDVGRSPQYLTTRFDRVVAKKYAPFTLMPDTGDGIVYQDEFVHATERAFPYAARDDRRKIFYSLDNEPDLWSRTHPRLQPQAVSYTTLLNKSIQTAVAVKDAAPEGLVFGAANYGFNGFESLQDAPDAGGRNFLTYYLSGMAEAERMYGRRLLDVLDIHWYPEARGGGRRIIEDDASPDTAAARIQAPRSLWDASYRESSWIADARGPIALLPGIKQKIAAHYPGTKLAITEYYYGGGDHISGALAQADALGIFGREGVFAASLWHLGRTDDRCIYGAFAMYRNFDGRGGTFADTSIAADTTDPAKTSVYASVDQDDPNRATAVVINKTAEALTADIVFENMAPMRTASVYRLTGESCQPAAAGTIAVEEGNKIRYTMPAYSVSTLAVTRER